MIDSEAEGMISTSHGFCNIHAEESLHSLMLSETWMDTHKAPEPSVRVLSLDGGGIRGKSSLIILENIMEHIRHSEGLIKVPKPCDYFDLIGGTSTGGIIAVMLGRLGMTVDECIRAYENVGQAAFTPKRTIASRLPGPPKGAFSATALEAAIKRVVGDNCTDPGCINKRSNAQSTGKTCPHEDLRFRDQTCTKTVVLAITKANVDTYPTLFTTYGSTTNYQNCSIWQVCRATSAATTFFKSIKLGRDKVEFIDAGFGYNNPCEILIEEAKKQYPGREFQVLSVGTGLGTVVGIVDSRQSILEALKKMASTSNEVAARLKRQYGDGGQYYRFNVDRGLEDITLSDWENTSTVSAHTHNYLQENEKEVEKFVGKLLGGAGEQRQVVADIFNTRNERAHTVPFLPNTKFTGRKQILHHLEERLLVRQDCKRLAIYGLGGMGKSQVALQFAYLVKQNQPQYSVFWVPAFSEESFTQAYKEIGTEVGIPIDIDKEDPRLSVQRHLSSKNAGRWLLIVDNADDRGALFGKNGIYHHLPQSETGLMIFTTRFKEIALSLAETDITELKEMETWEAEKFLEASLLPGVLRDEITMTELLVELCYLPLAIAQAAAYLNRNESTSVRRYLELLRGTENDLAGLLGREFPANTRYGLPNSIAATWTVSFEQIKNSKAHAPAADLLSFISCIEPKAIPRSILPELGSDEEMEFAIGTLTGYNFLTSRGVEEMYEMHSLVHTASRIWIQQQVSTEKVLTKAIQHLTAIFPSLNPANRQAWQAYLPHAFRLLNSSKGIVLNERIGLIDRVGRCLYLNRRFRDAAECFEEVKKWQSTHLPDTAPSQLALEQWLAGAYLGDRRIKDAIKISEHIVEVRRNMTPDEKDPARLASENQLAMAYLEDWRTQDAIGILEHVVKARGMALDEKDNARLLSEHNLASAYLHNEQIPDAIRILEHVLKVKKETLDKKDIALLSTEHNLASAYLENKQIPDAIGILEHVVKVEKEMLDEKDHTRLSSESTLGRAYLDNTQILDAIKILEHVVRVQGQVLDEEDHARLVSEHALAQAYSSNEQIPDMIRILEHIVEVQGRLLDKEDPARLLSESVLAQAYLDNGADPGYDQDAGTYGGGGGAGA